MTNRQNKKAHKQKTDLQKNREKKTEKQNNG